MSKMKTGASLATLIGDVVGPRRATDRASLHRRVKKVLARFPEIHAQKGRENGTIGIDDVTEYFLVGSFASWIVALGGLVLVLTQ